MRTALVLTLLLAAAASAQPIIVQLTLSNGGCRYDLSLNGVPLTKADTSDGFTTPINGWLAGASNTIEVQVAPTEGTNCRLEIEVTEAQKPVAKGSVDAKAKALKLELASSVDALGPWLAARPFGDEKALKAYAVKLAGLVRSGQVDAWVKEAAPKYAELSKAFGVDAALLSSSERRALLDFKKVLPVFPPSEVVVEPLLGGRLHRLRWSKHPSALFHVKAKDEERTFDVVVGAVDGALKVVR